MRLIKGISLIGWAGQTLRAVPFIDARVISTDSPEYASEGQSYGLDAPFLRPSSLSTDEAGAIETVQHALLESERHFSTRFDVILIVEPTSPLRTPQDIECSTRRLIEADADSVVTVSPLSEKFYPLKLLKVNGDRLDFFTEEGKHVKRRQNLKGKLYWRNGVCYALTRYCIVERQAILTERSIAEIIYRPIVNIDDATELSWAEYLMSTNHAQT